MRGSVRALLVVIALVLVGDGIALTSIDDSPYPQRWDKRLSDLASFVEDTRHLRFEHPVEARFVTVAEYKELASVGSGAADLTAQDKEDIANFNGEMRALGLIDKDTDVFEQSNQIVDDGSLAYYDPDKKEVVVRGTGFTVDTRVTLVHELTHALQDQHFDLSRSFRTSGGDAFFHALGEGDAVRVENEYIDQLSEADQETFFEAADQQGADAEESLDDIAPALLQMFEAPYALGEPMTTLIVAEKGVKELDRLFRRPPESDEGMFNVFTLLDGDKPQRVAAPKLGAGEEQTDEGDFGSITWYITLANFVDQRTALRAVDGWGGDSYVGYKKGGKSCIRIAFEGDAARDNVEMSGALNQWKEAFPPGGVRVTTTTDRVELDACEPADVPAPQVGADQSLSLPAARLSLVASVLAQGAPRATAECFVSEFLDQIDLAKLTSDTEADAEDLFNLGVKIGRLCAKTQPA